MMLNLQAFLPQACLCCCLRPRYRQKLKILGYKHLLQEVTISNIIQQLRVVSAACQESRTAEQWETLQKKHKLIAYEDLQSDHGNQGFKNKFVSLRPSRRATLD